MYIQTKNLGIQPDISAHLSLILHAKVDVGALDLTSPCSAGWGVMEEDGPCIQSVKRLAMQTPSPLAGSND